MTRLSRYSEAAALLEGWALAACSLLFGRGWPRSTSPRQLPIQREGYAAAFAALEPVAEVGCILAIRPRGGHPDALQESCQRASEGSRGAVGFLRVDDSAAASSLASAPEQREDGPRLPCPSPGRCGVPSFKARRQWPGKSLCESDPPPGFSGREILLPEGLLRNWDRMRWKPLGAGVTPWRPSRAGGGDHPGGDHPHQDRRQDGFELPAGQHHT